jgi:DNA-binding response OmpR family regulator
MRRTRWPHCWQEAAMKSRRRRPARVRVAVLDRFTPEVALLDIGLPDVSGYELAREVRARLRDKVLLIAITGWGQDADRARAVEAGFDHHLTKPVDHEKLHRLLA